MTVTIAPGYKVGDRVTIDVPKNLRFDYVPGYDVPLRKGTRRIGTLRIVRQVSGGKAEAEVVELRG